MVYIFEFERSNNQADDTLFDSLLINRNICENLLEQLALRRFFDVEVYLWRGLGNL